MDDQTADFARSFVAFTEAMTAAARRGETDDLTEVGRLVEDFLGVGVAEVAPVTERFPVLQVVDLDLALESLLTELSGSRYGIRGPHREHAESFADFLSLSSGPMRRGPVSYQQLPTGPDTERRVVTLAVGLVRLDGVPLVWLQRAPAPQYGRDRYTLEVLCPDPATGDQFLRRVRTEMSRRSVLRGQVISLTEYIFDYHAPGERVSFERRPEVTADQVVLPDGVLERVVRQVIGIGAHRDLLRAAGQHLKRGVLLYGPPGTGKTHLVRHLLTRTPGTTAILLSGRSLALLGDAATLARATEPALIVLEDCDLVAEERGGETNAVLFETLEAMDGLAPDADVTFVLTTNRVDLLERALIERPGRVDLAVEIGRPDLEARRRLFELYGGALFGPDGLGPEALEAAAARTEGVTASFAKEAIRRTVLNAAETGRPPEGGDLERALDEMLSDAEALTRSLLGGGEDRAGGEDGPEAFEARPGLWPGSVTWELGRD